MVKENRYANWKMKKLEKEIKDEAIVKISKVFDSYTYDLNHDDFEAALVGAVNSINGMLMEARDDGVQASLFCCMTAISDEMNKFFDTMISRTYKDEHKKLIRDYRRIINRFIDIAVLETADVINGVKKDKKQNNIVIHAYNGETLYEFKLPMISI